MKNLMPLMVLALIVLMGCAKEETNELVLANDTVSSLDNDGEATTRKKSKPFQGTIVYTGNENSLECDCPPESVGQFTGSGNLTHLGLTTSEIDVCNTSPDCGDFPNYGFTVYKQCTVFTAANGDELWGTVTDTYSVCGAFPDPYLYGEAVIEFDGGTGRFEGATGQADVEIIVTLDETFSTESVSSVFDGTINY